MNVFPALSTFAIGFAAGILTMWGAMVNIREGCRRQELDRAGSGKFVRVASKRLILM